MKTPGAPQNGPFIVYAVSAPDAVNQTTVPERAPMKPPSAAGGP
jgi:hypothetical protein